MTFDIKSLLGYICFYL